MSDSALSSTFEPRLKRKNNIVLIADDDAFIRKLINTALIDFATIVEVEDGAQVLELYKKHEPDVLLLDIHMPNMKGSDVLKEILQYDSDAYVIMISADGIPQNVVNTVHVGAKGFVVKPFAKEALLKYVLASPTFRFQDI